MTIVLSNVTPWIDGDPGSPTVMNTKLNGLISNISSLVSAFGAPVAVYSGNSFVASVGTMQFLNHTINYSSSSTGVSILPLVSVYSGPTLMGSVNTIRFKNSSITTAAGEVTITPAGTGTGGQLVTQVAGLTVGSIGTLNLNSGAFRYSVDTPSSTGSIDFLGMNRGQVTIQTAALASGASEVGSVSLGATSFPIAISSLGKCWLQLYGSAANRALDASRSSLSDPSTPEVYEAVFGALKGFEIEPKTQWSNVESPSNNSIYYRITQLEDTSGGATGALASDNLVVQGFTADTPVNDPPAHVPTNPGTSGWTIWEYGSATSRYEFWKTYGGVMGRVGIIDFTLMRTSVNFSHKSLTVYSDYYRTQIDGVTDAGGFGLFVPDTSIATWDFANYILCQFSRGAVNTINANVMLVNSLSTASNLTTGTSGFSFAPNASLRLGVHCTDTAMIMFTSDFGTGANEVSVLTCNIPSGFTGSHHSRVGLYNARFGAATGLNANNFFLSQSGFSGPVACQVVVTRVLGETA